MDTTKDNLALPSLPIVQREEWLINYCKGKTVLHLGCADAFYTDDRLEDLSTLLHYRLAEVAARIVGLDISKEDLDKLRSRWPQWELVEGNVEHLEKITFDAPFDVVVAGELIEHIFNPGLFLTSVLPHLKPEAGRLIITTPNHFGTRRLAHLLRGREKVHPHHTCYYSYNTLKKTVESCGYTLEQALGYSSWPPPNALKRALHSALETLPGKLFSTHSCDGLIFVAKPCHERVAG